MGEKTKVVANNIANHERLFFIFRGGGGGGGREDFLFFKFFFKKCNALKGISHYIRKQHEITVVYIIDIT